MKFCWQIYCFRGPNGGSLKKYTPVYYSQLRNFTGFFTNKRILQKLSSLVRSSKTKTEKSIKSSINSVDQFQRQVLGKQNNKDQCFFSPKYQFKIIKLIFIVINVLNPQKSGRFRWNSSILCCCWYESVCNGLFCFRRRIEFT